MAFRLLTIISSRKLPKRHAFTNSKVRYNQTYKFFRIELQYKPTLFLEMAINQSTLLKRGLYLEYITLGWNVVGTVIVIIAALASNSVALAGFGFDSLIEIFASVVVVWQLKGVNLNRERLALRLIGVAFLILTLYVFIQSVHTLLVQTKPDTSVIGLIWLVATFFLMLSLSWGKYRTGKMLVNQVLLTEGRVTLVDAYLAGAVLVGLILNALLGWWWADPLAGLVIVYYGIREGWHALKETKE